jgi:outer membrane protein OmpA-like peptidoglycan-associated protein
MKLLTSYLKSLAVLAVVGPLLFGCSAAVMENASLDQAKAGFAAARNDPAVFKNAPLELQRAQADLDQADMILKRQGDIAEVEHLAYLAQQRTAIARETTNVKLAEQSVEAASIERNKVLLEARSLEADLALKKAQMANEQAMAQQKLAEMARAEAEAKTVEAEKARMAALSAEERAKKLEAQIDELNAVKSERGLVITLGDVLFDTNKSDLRSGALFTIDKLAAFLAEYPNRKVMIEGFTDSRGSEEYNQELSVRRAESVQNALVAKGTDSGRIMVRGYGEAFPVANNATAEGQQRNRRVEVIVSDDAGQLAERTK